MSNSCLTYIRALSAVLMFLVLIPYSPAQYFPLNNRHKTGLQISENSYKKLSASYYLEGFKMVTINTPQGAFSLPEADGFTKTYDIGKALLPVMSKLIEMPYHSGFQIHIKKALYKEIKLKTSGISKIVPAQPSYFKNTEPGDRLFLYDTAYYATDHYFEKPLVELQKQGVMRGVPIGRMIISPFAYNPAQNTLRVYYNIEFEISFTNADVPKTVALKEKYYSPVFRPVFSQLINYKIPAVKESLCSYPITYVIVSPNTFQAALQPFIQWKTKKGFKVIEAYTSDPNVGTTSTSIKSYLQGLYNAGTPANPAPSYVLLVGDVAQIPAFTGSAGSHATDLYYCEYDGGSDYIPDIYYGRFSATNLTQLQPQIDKTLLYEKYLMDLTSYLDTVVMVAGVDASYAPTYANGQVNYGVNNYFNASNGIYSRTYLYPASQSSAAQIRADIGQGVGLANYTAHCSSSGWGDPSFTTSHISAMSNTNKYGLMIGNCCLSNKFDDTECFGEGLLRAVNKGAVGYIGGTNNTLWDEDYFWGVGYTANITANPTYTGTGLGAYDCVFHTHNEPESDWFVTNDQMIFAGNMAVQASASTNKKYYWEIYHLMGDPSLMTYLHEPTPLFVTYNNPIIVGETTLTVSTEPGAYVALSNNNVLLSAALADVNGLAQLTFAPFLNPDTADIVVTKQNKIPFTGNLKIINIALALDASVAQIIEPESQYNCAGLSVTPKVLIRNMGLNSLQTLTVKYNIDNGNTLQYVWNGALPSLGTDTLTLPSFNLTQGNHTIKVFSTQPNNSPDLNLLNDTLTKSFTVNNLVVDALFGISDTTFCNAPATVGFTNLSTNGLNYEWDFGDGYISTEAGPTHTYQNVGHYTVTLTAHAGICGSDTFTFPIDVSVGLPAPIVADAENCGPASLTLSASGYSNINWYYTPTTPVPFFNGTSYTTPVLDTTTTYYVQGTFTNPVKNAGKPDSTGSGGYYNNASNVHYLIFNSYVPAKLLTVKVYATGTGNRTILLRDATGMTLDSLVVLISAGEQRITLDFDLPVANNLQLVATGNTNLYRNNNNSATYPYELPGVLSVIESSASLPPYNSPNNYYYFYDWEVKENDCYSIMEPVTAYILDIPVSSFSFTQNAYTVQFTNQSQYATAFAWDFGDGTTSVQANPSHTYSAPGPYTVKLKIENLCGTDSTEHQITIQGMAPVADFIADQVNIDQGDSVHFTDLSSYTPDTWSWLFEGGTPSSSGIQNPVVQYNTAGSFYVTLIATNSFGTNYSNKPYYINVAPSGIQNTATGNDVKIFPNPVYGNTLYITTSTPSDMSNIGIYSVLGEHIPVVLKQTGQYRFEISVTHLSSGLYFLDYNTPKGREKIRFIVF